VSLRESKLAVILLACSLAGACGSPANRITNPALEAARSSNEAATRAFNAGNTAQALSLYRSSLAGAESIEDFELAGANLLNIAAVHARLGQWSEAHGALDKVIAAPANFGRSITALAALRKAMIFLDEGNAPQALQWADNAERGCAAPCTLLATVENLRAHFALEAGRTEDAVRHASRAAELASDAALQGERANAWRFLGRAYSRAGRHAEAAKALADALNLDRRLGQSAGIALDLIYAGDNEVLRNDNVQARAFYERAAAVYNAADNAAGARAARSRLEALSK
jgi:tetratricopeptide (TPR) repeat protein